MCAFINTDGGKLVVGVRDDGKIVGVKDSKKLLKTLPDKIRNKLGIIPSVSVEIPRDSWYLKVFGVGCK
ncbi:MAG: hypothetical protein DRN18_02155 [Thermoplasmata archaeon]|nr:MAG: hypothetical protein DRN18_02155 [Thermoplasmata archaeon]